jgi:cell division protein FtsQ
MHLRVKLACVVATLLAGYGFWIGVVRNLSLFQVQHVTITGLSGGAAPQIASALKLTARGMTTTNVSVGQLRSAVSGYTSVADLTVHTHFPHGLAINVVENNPIARLDFGGTIVAVSAKDRVLAGLVASRSLPLVRTTLAPVGGVVRDSLARQELALLAAAPAPLRDRVYSLSLGSQGFTAQLRNGPLIYFGNATLPHAKWASAAVVLASATSHGASYVDVSLPSRPAAQVNDPETNASSVAAEGSTSSASIGGLPQTGSSSSTSG